MSGISWLKAAEVSHASHGFPSIASHLTFIATLSDAHLHGISIFLLSLDDLEPFLRSAETQARAYAFFGRPEYLLFLLRDLRSRKGNKRKENIDRLTTAVRHGHLIPSNWASHCFHKSHLRNLSFPRG